AHPAPDAAEQQREHDPAEHPAAGQHRQRAGLGRRSYGVDDEPTGREQADQSGHNGPGFPQGAAEHGGPHAGDHGDRRHHWVSQSSEPAPTTSAPTSSTNRSSSVPPAATS